METQSNPNDFKVVQFQNTTNFDFTPEMGCMYDSRPVFGISGEACIKAGETMTLPYHIGMLLAQNLAKAVMVRQAPVADTPGVPTGVPLWDTAKLESLKNSYIKELYSEQKPIAQTETDRLIATVIPPTANPAAPLVFQDKGDVLAELERRNIPHDKRKSKIELEKLLQNPVEQK